MKALTTNTKQLLANNKTASDIVYYGIEHPHRTKIANEMAELGINTLKQFLKYDFEAWWSTNKSAVKITALTKLQTKLNKYMSKVAPVAKKKTAKKVKAKKVKPVAKKKVAKKVSIKDKYTKLYKIVTQYSDSLMQDVYSVVYKDSVLKRFVNTNLANKFIEQEVLVKMNEHAIRTAKKNKALQAELSAEFEG